MELGSGSTFDNYSDFSCKRSTLDPDGITNTTIWEVREEIVKGKIGIALVISFLFVIAFTWNLFIIITYIVKHNLLKQPANIFLFTLAITDFMISLLVLPISVVNYAAERFILGDNDKTRCDICYTQAFFLMFLILLSLHILASLSVDRCFLLSQPIKYKKKCKPVFAVVTIISLWFICSFVIILPVFGFGEWEFNRSMALCIARWQPFENLYFMAFVMMEAMIPIIILCVTNIWTYKIVRRFLKKRLTRRRSYRGSRKEMREDDHSHQRQQTQLVKVFGALFIAHCITWTPIVLMIVVVAATQGEGIPDYIFVIGWILTVSNSAVHPIIESFFNKELRVTVNRTRKSIKKNMRRASRSLIRLTTRESMRNIPSVSENVETPVGEKVDSVALNCTRMTDIPDDMSNRSLSSDSNSPTPNGKISPNPEYLKKAEVPGVHQTGATSSPLALRYTSEFFYSSSPTNGDTTSSRVLEKKSRHISMSVPGEDKVHYYSKSSSPISDSDDSAIHSGDSSLESKPRRNPLKKPRHVSLSLPNDDNVYYPRKSETKTDTGSVVNGNDTNTVFDEDLESKLQRTPLKNTRHVSLSLPNDDHVYYPKMSDTETTIDKTKTDTGSVVNGNDTNTVFDESDESDDEGDSV